MTTDAAPGAGVATDDPISGSPRADGPGAWDWVERAVVLVGLAVASLGLAALVLGMAGAYSTPRAVLLTLVPTGFALWALTTRTPACAPGFGWRPLVLAGVLVALVVAFWGYRPSQHVIVNRDPGAYVDTAVVLAETGSITVDQSDTPFGDLPAKPGGATYVTGPGTYEFQFNHLLPGVLAPAYDIGGPRLLFRMPALIMGLGLMGVYLLAVRATRRPWLSCLVPVVLGVSMPMMYVARDAFSESVAFMLLWCGLLAAAMALERARAAPAVLAGWVVGSTTAARVDSLVYLIALVPLLILWIEVGKRVATQRERLLCALSMALGAVVPVAIGVIDLDRYTGTYAATLSSRTALLRIGLVVAVVAGAGLAWASRAFAGRLRVHRATLGWTAAVVVVTALLFMWFVRPVVLESHRAEFDDLVGYQAREGVEVDPTRNYREAAFAWMEWYYGAVVVGLAVVGIGLIAQRAVNGRAGPVELLVAVSGVAVGLLYWWSPSIFPDQPWGSRRFVPAVYPAVVIVATMMLGWIASVIPRSPFRGHRWIVAVVAAAMVLAPATTTWPVRWGRTQDGYEVALGSLCAMIGDDAAVVTIEAQRPRGLAPAIRGWCDVPTMTLDAPNTSELRTLAGEWASEGRSLWVVSRDRRTVERSAPLESPPRGSEPGLGREAIERTLTHPPRRYRPDETIRFWAGEVRPG